MFFRIFESSLGFNFKNFLQKQKGSKINKKQKTETGLLRLTIDAPFDRTILRIVVFVLMKQPTWSLSQSGAYTITQQSQGSTIISSQKSIDK